MDTKNPLAKTQEITQHQPSIDELILTAEEMMETWSDDESSSEEFTQKYCDNPKELEERYGFIDYQKVLKKYEELEREYYYIMEHWFDDYHAAHWKSLPDEEGRYHLLRDLLWTMAEQTYTDE